MDDKSSPWFRHWFEVHGRRAYAAGLTVRDMQAHLGLHGLTVSPDLISRVTDAVLDEVREWQSRALERMVPIVIFDALRVKIRDADSRTVKNKAVYVVLGASPARASARFRACESPRARAPNSGSR